MPRRPCMPPEAVVEAVARAIQADCGAGTESTARAAIAAYERSLSPASTVQEDPNSRESRAGVRAFLAEKP